MPKIVYAVGQFIKWFWKKVQKIKQNQKAENIKAYFFQINISIQISPIIIIIFLMIILSFQKRKSHVNFFKTDWGYTFLKV